MKNLKDKEETIRLVDEMILHADKGPSGFWTEDYEGCGNPQIFPEFLAGLKKGRLVQKDHYLCPWNTAIMYGDGHGNIDTGCYHSCSFDDAKYLPTQKLKSVLERFNGRLKSGQYDNTCHLVPLLTDEEIRSIAEGRERKAREMEKKEAQERKEREIQARALLDKYAGNDEVCSMILAHYGQKMIVQTPEGDVYDFAPDRMKDIVGGERLTYDDYIDLQIRTANNFRRSFRLCYMYHPLEFKGCIERITARAVCFKRIFVSGMYDDGVCFDGKEDHVWMAKEGFEEYHVGDCLSFFAKVYRYIKTSKGKRLDYSLRCPDGIKKIPDYELPSDRELKLQEIDGIICECCPLSDQCSHQRCLRSKKELNQLRKGMLASLSEKDNGGQE